MYWIIRKEIFTSMTRGRIPEVIFAFADNYMKKLSNKNETMSHFHWTNILTHPIASAMLSPSLHEERGKAAGGLRVSNS